MNNVCYVTVLAVLWRAGLALTILVSCSRGFADEQTFGSRELAALVKPHVPEGWTVSVKGDEVVLRRAEPIEIYNSLQMPPGGWEKEIRQRMRKFKLAISLRIEAPIGQEEYREIVEANKAAYAQAKKDQPRNFIFLPNSQFWRGHPQYGYRDLPSFDLGHHSVVLTTAPESVVFVGRRPHRHYLFIFKDAQVEAECQGIVDDLARLWPTYKTAEKESLPPKANRAANAPSGR